MPPRPDVAMLSSDPLASELALPAVDLRALGRRAAVPALGAVGVAAAVYLAGGLAHPLAEAAGRLTRVSPLWLGLGAGLECVSLAGYVMLLSLVAGRATGRIGVRESAQITLAGAAATRVLPTAGAGGAALTVWTLRRAGLRAGAAGRVLLVFFVLLYAVFLSALAIAGVLAALELTGGGPGPAALAATAAGAGALAIAVAVGLARRVVATTSRSGADADTGAGPDGASRHQRASAALGSAVREAVGVVRTRDVRLAGAVAYWALDAAVLWTMLHAFGAPPALPVIGLAYLLGQVANTVPLPGSVSGGMAGVLIAFHVPAGLAVPAVLAYRTIAVWLPLPAGAAAVPRLRATVAAWGAPAVQAGCAQS